MTQPTLIPVNAPTVFLAEDGSLCLYRPNCKYFDRIVKVPQSASGLRKIVDILKNLKELEAADRLMAKRSGREDDFVPTYDLVRIAREWEKAGGQIEKMPPCKSGAAIQEEKRKTKSDKVLEEVGVDDDFINGLELNL